MHWLSLHVGTPCMQLHSPLCARRRQQCATLQRLNLLRVVVDTNSGSSLLQCGVSWNGSLTMSNARLWPIESRLFCRLHLNIWYSKRLFSSSGYQLMRQILLSTLASGSLHSTWCTFRAELSCTECGTRATCATRKKMYLVKKLTEIPLIRSIFHVCICVDLSCLPQLYLFIAPSLWINQMCPCKKVPLAFSPTFFLLLFNRPDLRA